MYHNSIGAVNEDELLVSIKEGNLDTFGFLYDNYAPALFGIASRIVDKKELAEEILQKTFVKAWNQAVDCNISITSLFTWLANLTRQTAFEEIKVQRQTNPEYPDPVYIGNNKAVFDLLYYEGLNCMEAATVLNIPVENIKSGLRLAIKELKVNEIVC